MENRIASKLEYIRYQIEKQREIDKALSRNPDKRQRQSLELRYKSSQTRLTQLAKELLQLVKAPIIEVTYTMDGHQDTARLANLSHEEVYSLFNLLSLFNNKTITILELRDIPTYLSSR